MRRWLVTCLFAAPVAACSPFNNSDSFSCHSSGDCNLNGMTGVCTANTCVYGASPIDAPTPTADAPMMDPLQSDAPLEAGIDARECWGSTLQVCMHPPPSQSHSLDLVFDTGDSSNCDKIITQTGGPDLCVIGAVDWTLTELQVIGSRPLVVFATDTITTKLTVSASGGSKLGDGPGADDSSCTTPSATNNGAGGAGGAFAGAGGAGGAGDNRGTTASPPPVTITTIRGGCAGQSGKGTGTGGHSGGAIYLLAGNMIDIQGELLADGAGGGGGPADPQHAGGGGGGGTGGFIGLEAPAISGGYITARAGAGGGGGGSTPAGLVLPQPPTAGGDGDGGDNYASNGHVRGGGGGTAQGGEGGDAGDDTGDDGDSGGGGAGGGGGGGGVGVIWVTSGSGASIPGATVSPTPIAK